ncbi:hypothetical protein [Bacillus pacificus]|uniref:hypothetical protein n=1 Tax=Bacillus pacificus TaxID=2026187 RepID=UPI001175B021|nr:hypothetical protein [Bacillus pacificus]TNP01439.1 hypothetical protein FHY68_21935 [Bacillus pacificus]
MVNTQYLTVYLVHKYVMDRPLSIEDLSDRVITQKVVYLADVLGINCGDYNFTWYKKGPYSPALTTLLYNHKEDTKEEYAHFNLTANAVELLEPLKEAMSYRPDEISEVDWIELIASLHYLYDNSGSDSIEKIITKLISLKPKYSRSQVIQALEILEKIGIIY